MRRKEIAAKAKKRKEKLAQEDEVKRVEDEKVNSVKVKKAKE